MIYVTRISKTRKSILIRGNAAACALIYWFGTLANSASTGIPEYYAHETRWHNRWLFL